ncbi:MAG: alpha/beta hydrolase [Planctomycetes bacterium]|nr:alpha/beta hydrolase [Planctomycetota bacterium]
MNFKSDVVYGSVNGAALIADIAWPESDEPLPVIISVHGGRWIRGTRHDNAAIDVKAWAAKGFFAMCIDYRLVTCTPAPACYQDVICAIRWAHAQAETYNLNRKQVFLIGQSAGGHMVSLAATLGADGFKTTGGHDDFSPEFQGVISVSGAYNIPDLDWGSGWSPSGVDWFTAQDYASPLKHVSATTKPILFFHSDNDPSVPIAQALEMKAALEKHKTDHEFVHYPDQGHLGITDEVIEKSLAFINRLK